MSLARVVQLRRLSLTRRDSLVLGAVAVPVLGSLVYRAVHDHQPLVVLLGLAALLAVLLREREPLVALLVAVVLRGTIPDNQALLLPALVVLYSMASRRSWPIPAATSESLLRGPSHPLA